MQKDYDVLGLGVAAVDDLLYVDTYPPPETKTRVRLRLRQCGGLTGTALVAAARLGASCAYAGMLGNDELSEFVKKVFAREKIDCRQIVFHAEAVPAHSTIIVDEQNHTRTVFASLNGLAGPAETLPREEIIAGSRVLLIDHHGIPGTRRAVEIARRNSIPVVADFERHPGEGFDALVAEVDHLVLSGRFARSLTGQSDPAASIHSLWNDRRRAVAVTCGKEGCYYTTDGKKIEHQSAFDVATVDTTGCGDVFHGAYAAALARRMPVKKIIAFASATAALKAMQRGGQAGCPSREEVETFMKG